MIDISANNTDPSRSHISLAYNRLKRDLLAGVISPGEKLAINELAARHCVGPAAVREALSRFVPEGLVVFRDQKGFIAAPLSAEDLDGLTQMRCDIEELALRRSVAIGDADWECLVLATSYRLQRTTRKTLDGIPNPDWLTQHDRFHAALASACGNWRLLGLRSTLHGQAERYLRLSAIVESAHEVDAEHQTLADAALKRDAEKLVGLAREHIERTTALIKVAITAREAQLAETA